MKFTNPSKGTFFSLDNWREWKSSLLMDHVTEYDRQSQQRRINNEMGWVGK